jgi:hypothetical protein
VYRSEMALEQGSRLPPEWPPPPPSLPRKAIAQICRDPPKCGKQDQLWGFSALARCKAGALQAFSFFLFFSCEYLFPGVKLNLEARRGIQKREGARKVTLPLL